MCKQACIMEASAATIRDRVRRQNAVTLNHQQAIYTEKLRPSRRRHTDVLIIERLRRIGGAKFVLIESLRESKIRPPVRDNHPVPDYITGARLGFVARI